MSFSRTAAAAPATKKNVISLFVTNNDSNPHMNFNNLA